MRAGTATGESNDAFITIRTYFINRRTREDGLDGCSASGATQQCAVQTIFPKGSHQNRRWTALRSLRICMAIRRVARLASPDSGANACPPIYEMSSNATAYQKWRQSELHRTSKR